MAQRYLANSEIYNEIFKNKIIAVDGGARGEIFEPFDRLNENIAHYYRFEPDQDAPVEEKSNETIIRKAIWSESKEIELHVAKNPAASSVYPPNQELLERFVDKIGYPPRKTVKKVKVDAVHLDAVFEGEERSPQFLKLDIHGSEYEAIQGATQIIDQSVTGILIETWNIPVHRGQKTHGFIDHCLQEKGFFMFDQLAYSLWDRKGRNKLASNTNIVTFESLYFKNMDALAKHDRIDLLATVAIANLFKQNAYAIQTLELLKEKNFISDQEAKSLESFLLTSSQENRLMDKQIMPYLRQKVERRLF